MASTIYILLRNDDPGALSDPAKERRVLELFERYKAPQVLAVIPNNVEDPHVTSSQNTHLLEENPAVVHLLKEYHAKGLIEIAQHGYTHQTNRFRPGKTEKITEGQYYQGINRRWAPYDPPHTEGYSELSGLPEEEQRDKVVKGQKYLENIFGVKLKSFIFPWNSYDPAVLRILKEQGFRYVPCDEDTIVVPDLCLIGACYWDWEIDKFRRLIKELESVSQPVLMQFAYHSWEIDDDMIAKIEGLLQEISAMPNVKFIKPSDIARVIPPAAKAIRERCQLLQLEKRINLYLRKVRETPRYYVLDPWFYTKQIIKLSVSYFILSKIGLQRFNFISIFVLGAFSYWAFQKTLANRLGVLDLTVLSLLVMAVVIYYFIKRRVEE